MKSPDKIIGTLLPLTALKSIEEGYTFIDWIEMTKQSAWQLLPLHETQLETGSKSIHVPSPYKSYGIGLDSRYQVKNPKFEIRNSKNQLFDIFIEKNKDWVEDYSLFCALRDHFGTDDWTKWEHGLVRREKETLEVWTKKLQNKINIYLDQQYHLHNEYSEMHEYALSKGIVLIGDLPYYPSFRSPLVWAHQEVFQINEDGTLPFVSGIPDTPSAHFGRQVWGHPLYNWAHEKEKVVEFWKMRLHYIATIFDHIRFDHAKAFFSYGVMVQANPSEDHYALGPGREVFKSLIKYGQEQGITIFVEDSGERTEEIRAVQNEISLPGIRIFKFALKGDHLQPRYVEITNYPENSVAYTTTHDTETLLGYLQLLSIGQKHQLSAASGIEYNADDKLFAVNIRNALVSSKAKLVIIPLQDWLLTTDRINIPGTEKEIGDTNWQYRLKIPIEELPTKLF